MSYYPEDEDSSEVRAFISLVICIAIVAVLYLKLL